MVSTKVDWTDEVTEWMFQPKCTLTDEVPKLNYNKVTNKNQTISHNRHYKVRQINHEKMVIQFLILHVYIAKIQATLIWPFKSKHKV